MSSLAVARSQACMARRLTSGTVAGVARPASRLPLERGFFTIIHQGHEAWRLRLGRDPVHLEPGLRIAIPLYHTIVNLDMRESSIQIPKLPGYTADNVPVTCSGSLFYRVQDSYKACFAVSDVHENITKIGQSAMRSVLGSFSYDQVISDRNGLNKQLNVVIGNTISNWGVECSRFEVQTFQPANREVERQLELQMEAERNRRKQLLDTQAQVNVAEGHKQRVILESEGHLVAKANEAEATYNVIVREAEARNKQSILEASALSKQVAELASSLTSSPDISPSPAQRQMALSALLSLARLEQLKAIANGEGNSTYFFGDKASLGSKMLEEYGVDFAEKIKAAAQTVSVRSGGAASPGTGGQKQPAQATDTKLTKSSTTPENPASPRQHTDLTNADSTQAGDKEDGLESLAADVGELVDEAQALANRGVRLAADKMVDSDKSPMELISDMFKDVPEQATNKAKPETL